MTLNRKIMTSTDEPARIKWFSNWSVWILVAILMAPILMFFPLILEQTLDTKSTFHLALNIIALGLILANPIALFGILILMYPVRYGLSREGIHLTFVGRSEILYWETIRSIERVRGDPILGSTIIRKSSGKKQNMEMIRNKVFREMNEQLREHRGRYGRVGNLR